MTICIKFDSVSTELMKPTLTSDIVNSLKYYAIVYDSMWIKIKTFIRVSKKKDYFTIRRVCDWKGLKYNRDFRWGITVNEFDREGVLVMWEKFEKSNNVKKEMT